MQGKSQEERASYFKDNKGSILSDLGLAAVSGGVEKSIKENPNSEEGIYGGNYFSSPGYVCDGEVICGRYY